MICRRFFFKTDHSLFVALKFPTRQPDFRISWTTAAQPWSCLGFDALLKDTSQDGDLMQLGFCFWCETWIFSPSLTCSCRFSSWMFLRKHTFSIFFFLQPNCYDVMCRMWCAFGMRVSQESQWHAHWENPKSSWQARLFNLAHLLSW